MTVIANAEKRQIQRLFFSFMSISLNQEGPSLLWQKRRDQPAPRAAPCARGSGPDRHLIIESCWPLSDSRLVAALDRARTRSVEWIVPYQGNTHVPSKNRSQRADRLLR